VGHTTSILSDEASEKLQKIIVKEPSIEEVELLLKSFNPYDFRNHYTKLS